MSPYRLLLQDCDACGNRVKSHYEEDAPYIGTVLAGPAAEDAQRVVHLANSAKNVETTESRIPSGVQECVDAELLM